MERKLGNNFAASVGYNGSHSYNIVGNGNSIGNVSYGVDINSFPGDLINQMNNSPTRVSPARPGSIPALARSPTRTTTAMAITTPCIFDFRGHFSRGFLDASYTRSRSQG